VAYQKDMKTSSHKIIEDIISIDIKPLIILSGYMGSISHGTHIPKENGIDDKDVMGIMVLPEQYYFGLSQKDCIDRFVGEWDIVMYEVKKFISLLLNANPNVLGLLWLPENLYVHKDEYGQAFIENRKMFLTKKCYASFCGYAYSQLHRMTHLAFKGYMGEKRKNLVLQHGYDTKNAAHLIRLLRMGIEALVEGELHVFRHDAEQLKSIKRGEWTLEQVKTEAERLFRAMETAYVNSKLPDAPDKEKAEKLLCEIIRSNLAKK